jgi:peptidoglycan/xylan/chitin deacetylase (PgdA/CDA1 family)
MRDNPSASVLVSGLAVAVLLVLGSLGHPPIITLASSLTTPSSALVHSTASEPVGTIPSRNATSVADSSGPVDTTPIPVGPIVGEAAPLVSPEAVDVTPMPVGNGLLPDPLTKTPAPRGFQHRTGSVPILMYHYIRVNPVASDAAGFNLSVTPTDFALQMRFLSTHGFTPVSIAEVRDYVRNKTPLPPNPIAITFDDGYVDAYSDALPTLDRFHFSATFYIVTGFVDQPRYVTWDQVAAMDHDGMQIASHTVHHISLTVLGALQRQRELVDSRSELEQRLGHLILDFSYPSGQIDPASEISVARAGYLSATTTAHGRADFGEDPLRLPRVRVSGGESLTTFAESLGLKTTAADYAGS